MKQMDERRRLHRLIVSFSPTPFIKLCKGKEADLELGGKYAELKEIPYHDLRNVRDTADLAMCHIHSAPARPSSFQRKFPLPPSYAPNPLPRTPCLREVREGSEGLQH